MVRDYNQRCFVSGIVNCITCLTVCNVIMSVLISNWQWQCIHSLSHAHTHNTRCSKISGFGIIKKRFMIYLASWTWDDWQFGSLDRGIWYSGI